MIVIVQMVIITKQIIMVTLGEHAMTLRIIFLYSWWRDKKSLKISLKFAAHKPSVLVMDAVGAGHGNQTVFYAWKPL